MATSFLDHSVGRLAYDVAGQDGAPLVLLVAGMGDTMSAFRFLQPLLVAQGYRVGRMDQRGHGESSVPWPGYGSPATGDDMLALIRHLGGPAIIVGHSNAAAAAIWAAAEAPELVNGIALIGPFLHDATLNPLLKLALKIVTHSPLIWSKAYYPSLYKAAKPAHFAEYTRAMHTTLKHKGRMAATAGVATEQERCRARIAELRCPVRIVMGSKDPDFPDPVGEATSDQQLLRAHTTVSVELIDGAGHYPHAELPDATAAALLPFLAEVSDA